MDPSSPTYKKFIKFLEKLPKNQLKQLAGANIKWVSMLAKNRLRGESVNEAKMSHVLTKDIGKKKMKDLVQYLWHVLDLAHNKDFRLSSNGKILAVNVDKINSKSIQNIKKRYGVDLKESVNEAFKVDIDKIMKHPKIKKLMQRLGVKKLQSQEAALKILNYFARNPAALAAFKKVGFESVEIKKEWG
jgi:predicted amino acid racemase